MKVFTALLATLLALLANPAHAESERRHTISADGTEVTDNKTGLIWRRCAEGMTASPDGCNGTSAAYTWEQAKVHAKSEATIDKAWRMPSFDELATIADARLNNLADVGTTQQGLDERELLIGPPKTSSAPVVFPRTPSTFFWSLPPKETPTSGAWYVFYNGGGVGDYGRVAKFRLRLVRNAKPGASTSFSR
ncbi:MAG: DUF1566 domain-containing protein [Pseudomonadota bacterium]